MTTGAPGGARVSEIALHVDDLELMTAFWAGVLAQEPDRAQDDGSVSFVLAPGVLLLLLPPERWDATRDGRLHLSLSPGPSSQEACVQRLLALGGRVVGPGGAGSLVVATPEGTQLVVHRV